MGLPSCSFTRCHDCSHEPHCPRDACGDYTSAFICYIISYILVEFSVNSIGRISCKLHHYGIRASINDWFSSYLNQRTQVLKLANRTSVSDKANILCGIPQGSWVLRTSTFSYIYTLYIYINDYLYVWSLIRSTFSCLPTICQHWID